MVNDILNSIEDVMCREFGTHTMISMANRPELPDSLTGNELGGIAIHAIENLTNKTIVLDNQFDLLLYDSFNLFNIILHR